MLAFLRPLYWSLFLYHFSGYFIHGSNQKHLGSFFLSYMYSDPQNSDLLGLWCVYFEKRKFHRWFLITPLVKNHRSLFLSLSPPPLCLSFSLSLDDLILSYGFHMLMTFKSKSPSPSLSLNPDYCIQMHPWVVQKLLIKLVLNRNHDLFL